MSQDTKKRLAEALTELLRNNDISKITISDIVSFSGVSRQTFYNHFIDIYDLLYWSHCDHNDEYVERFWEDEDFRKAFTGSLQMMKSRKLFYRQIMRKEGQNSFQNSFMQSNIELSKVRIKMVTGKDSTSAEDFLLELYWTGVSQMLVKWIAGGMQEDPKEMAQLFYDALPMSLRQYWLK